MKNEETKVFTQDHTHETVKTPEKKSNRGEKAAFAAGGFAAGLASGAAGSAMAAAPELEEVIAVNDAVVEEQSEILQAAPNPEEVLLATNEGIRVAQVDDEASFAEAFADARSQVGPGGTFEWRGNVYSTFYEEEWDNMSADERAEFQSKVDYQDMTRGNSERLAVESAYEEPAIAADAEMVDDDYGHNNGVRVLGVEAVVDEYGNPMTVAAVEVEGEQALLIDVDDNGTMDVIMVDENYDGQISDNEIYDISDAQICSADLEQQMAASQNPDMMYAYNDGMPDYMNDADVSSMA